MPHLFAKTVSVIIFISFLGTSLGVPFSVLAEENLYFIHQDHLGSTTVVTDENGDFVSQNRYYPYGQSRSVLGNQKATEKKYTGQRKDQNTGLYYYNARYYDPALSTFVSADTADDQLNRYAYAGGNPVMYSDPTGNQATAPILAGIHAFGGLLGYQLGAASMVTWYMGGLYQAGPEQQLPVSYLALAGGGGAVPFGAGAGGPQISSQKLGETMTKAGSMGVQGGVGLGALAGLAKAAAPLETAARAKIANWRFQKYGYIEWPTTGKFKDPSQYESPVVKDIARRVRSVIAQDPLKEKDVHELVVREVTNIMSYSPDVEVERIAELADEAGSVEAIVAAQCGGVCRHYAPLVAAIERELGREASVVAAGFGEQFGHAAAYLPKTQTFVDPDFGGAVSPSEWIKGVLGGPETVAYWQPGRGWIWGLPK